MKDKVLKRLNKLLESIKYTECPWLVKRLIENTRKDIEAWEE